MLGEINLYHKCKETTRDHFKFNPKYLQIVIDQLPSPFILMGDFNGHHTLCGCEDVNNRGQQIEDLILKNYLILYNDKCHIYFHSAVVLYVTSYVLTLRFIPLKHLVSF